jgi:hypothetical protein
MFWFMFILFSLQLLCDSSSFIQFCFPSLYCVLCDSSIRSCFLLSSYRSYSVPLSVFVARQCCVMFSVFDLCSTDPIRRAFRGFSLAAAGTLLLCLSRSATCGPHSRIQAIQGFRAAVVNFSPPKDDLFSRSTNMRAPNHTDPFLRIKFSCLSSF